jgi:hypothetical protein
VRYPIHQTHRASTSEYREAYDDRYGMVTTEPIAMSLASPLKILIFAAAMSACTVAAAQAEIPTLEFEASPPIHAGFKPLMAPTGRHRPHASDVPRGVRLDAVIRNEEEFDRAFGMCRRC